MLEVSYITQVGTWKIGRQLMRPHCRYNVTDDITLLAPSVSALSQRLLHVCETELQWLDMMSINVYKSA